MIIKTRLGLTHEELVEQIKENPYLQSYIGLESFQISAPKEAQDHIKANWPGVSWIIEMITTTVTRRGH